MKKLYFISPLFLQKLIWIPTRLILKFFGHLEVRGLENIRDIKTNVIFACNHCSELDPILIPASLPFWSKFSPIFYVSREQKFYGGSGWRRHFYGGFFFECWGSYAVQVGLRDYEKSLAKHIDIIGNGGSICIFPEGRTTPNGIMQPAKGGVAYLSHVTRVPIVPVMINGTYRLYFRDFLLRKTRLSVIFGKPIYVRDNNEKLSEISVEYMKEYAEKVLNIIKGM